jgi:hypothetical protein
VNASNQRVLIGALEIDFNQLLVFQNGHFSFVAVGGDYQLFGHPNSPQMKRAGRRAG